MHVQWTLASAQDFPTCAKLYLIHLLFALAWKSVVWESNMFDVLAIKAAFHPLDQQLTHNDVDRRC